MAKCGTLIGYLTPMFMAVALLVPVRGWTAEKSGSRDSQLILRVPSEKQWMVTGAQLSKDGRFLLLKYYEEQFAIWDLRNGNRVWETKELVGAAFIAADGKSVFSVGDQIRQWALPSGKFLRSIGPKVLDCLASPLCLAGTPDGKTLITLCGMDGKNFRAIEWNLNSGQAALTFTGPNHEIVQVAVSPDGKILAVACAGDQSVKLWDLATGKYVRSLSNGPHEETFSLAFLPDGKTLVAGCYDDRNEVTEEGESFESPILLWDWRAGKVERLLKGPADEVWTLAASLDGRWLAAGYGNDLADLWDLSTGKVRWTFRCKVDPPWSLSVEGLAVSPDGRYWVTGSTDGTTRFWDDRTGRELGRLISFKRGWVVMTPEGDFDGSPAGLQQLGLKSGKKILPFKGDNLEHRVPGLLAKILAGTKN